MSNIEVPRFYVAPETRVVLPEWKIPPDVKLASVDGGVITTTSHSGYLLPDYPKLAEEVGGHPGVLSEHFSPGHPRLHTHQLDLSDAGTGAITANMYQRNPYRVRFPIAFGRGFVNVNGPRQQDPMMASFCGIPVWEQLPDADVLEEVRKQYWDTNQAAMSELIERTLDEVPTGLVAIGDLHDTDVKYYNGDGKLVDEKINGKPFPQDAIVVSDCSGAAAPSKLTEIIGKTFGKAFSDANIIDPRKNPDGRSYYVNDPYKGGDATRRHGVDYPQQLAAHPDPSIRRQAGRVVGFQIEMGRSKYMNDDRTAVVPERIGAVAQASTWALAEICDTLLLYSDRSELLEA